MTECINCKGVIKLADYGPMGYGYYHLFEPRRGSSWCKGISGHATASDEDFKRDKELLTNE